MTFSTPWIGRKRVAFVPLFRSTAAPPDQIPRDWENVILRRVVYDPRPEAKGADRSLRAWLRAASSGLADIDPIVLPMQTIDEAGCHARRARGPAWQPVARSRHGRRRAGDARRPAVGHQWRLLVARRDGGKQRRVADGVDPRPDRLQRPLSFQQRRRSGRSAPIETFDEMSASSQTHPTAFTKNELGWLPASAMPLHVGASIDYELQHISLAQPPAAGRAAAVRIGNGVPYMMVEARKMTDQFETGMPSTRRRAGEGHRQRGCHRLPRPDTQPDRTERGRGSRSRSS